MSDMFCADLQEALKLEAEAKARAPQLLEELKHYIRTPGEIGIEVRRVLYPFSAWAIEADLTYDGDVVRHYEGFDLLELELNELELKVLLNSGIFSKYGDAPPAIDERTVSVNQREGIALDVPFWVSARAWLYVAGVGFMSKAAEFDGDCLRFLASYKDLHRLPVQGWLNCGTLPVEASEKFHHFFQPPIFLPHLWQ